MSLKVFEEIFAKRSTRIKPGLARVQAANELLGWPAQRVPSILVAGTNGKGTTSAFLWRLLSLGKVRCGLFTSPHLISFAERIQVSDYVVRESDLAFAVTGLRSRLGEYMWRELSFFELSLLLGFDVWRSARTELDVLEAGLGGRLDATNIAYSDCAVITSIGMDHADYLGNRIRDIAFEKSGIIRPGRPVFIGFKADSDDNRVALDVITAAARQLGSPVFKLDVDFGNRDGYFFSALDGQPAVDAILPDFFTGAPPYLMDNFSTAAAAAGWSLWRRRNLRSDICQLANVIRHFDGEDGPWSPAICGRFQRLSATDGQEFLLDVCHNPHGARRFIEGLEKVFGPDIKLPGLVSILRDKDIPAILDILTGKLDPIVLFKIPNERSFDAGAIPEKYAAFPLAENFSVARTMVPRASDAPVIVCGSVMAVGDALGRIVDGIEIKEISRMLLPEADQESAVRSYAQASALRRCLAMRDIPHNIDTVN